MKLRDYQIDISDRGVKILRKYNLLYLAMEVRTGKTLTSLQTAKLYGAKNVLFLTKVKAVEDIQKAYRDGSFDSYYGITVINDESMHLVDGVFDLIIHDEHHRFGAFPKMGVTMQKYRNRWSKVPMIFLSGTPTPESFSQIYHQFHVSDYSPFGQWRNFYSFAKEFVQVKDVKIRIGQSKKDYSDCNPVVMQMCGHLMITYTQQQAGFKCSIEERFITVPMSDKIKSLIHRLHKNKVIEGQREVILADTGAKLKSKTHQLCSGTVKFESGNSMVFDDTKARVIQNKFRDKKILLFYKYKAELEAIKQVFGEDVTEDINVWRKWLFDGVLALQIQSGREAITVKEADFIVFYNIDYSALSYWQARDRMTTIDREESIVFWVFTDGGMEKKIYERVMKKKNYTTYHFRNDYKLK